MDYSALIAKKLQNQDKCICSIVGVWLTNQQRQPTVLAIVQNIDDHGLFIYTVNVGKVSSPAPAVTGEVKDLLFSSAYPINNTFQYGVESSQASGISGGAIVLRVESCGQVLLIEIPYSDLLKVFINDLKRTVQLFSQNSCFGLPSTFDWLEKYRVGGKLGKPSSGVGFPPDSSGNSSLALLTDHFGSDQFLVGGRASGRAVDTSDRKSNAGKISDWPFDQIIQLSSDGKCPVVKDTTLHHSSSAPQSLKNPGAPSAPVAPVVQSRLYVVDPNHPSSKSIRRSYDKNLNKAANRDSSLATDALRKSRTQTARGSSPSPNNGGAAHSGAVGGGLVGAREFQADMLMKQREQDYINLVEYRVFCGTYNVNGQSAQSSLSLWLTPDGADSIPPDIYAVGFQELDLSTNAYIFSESAKEEEWLNKVRDALHPRAKYRRVKLIRLVGMMLVVFIRETLDVQVKELVAEAVGTGLLGMVGNKGGVAVRFRLFDTTLCFVNSHLAAHTEEYERRNQDFRDITSRMSFKVSSGSVSGVDTAQPISDHDIVFWLGDLNYRISDIEADECKRMIQKGLLEELMNYDQLSRQITLRRVFLDYTEAPIRFAPTYKYDPGTDNFDTSEKCRTPAWCDRILTRGNNVRVTWYRSHPELRLSDHKPVSALYVVGIKQIDPTRERRVREEVMKALDQRENDFLPQVQLDLTEVCFKDVRYIELHRQQIQVTNTGQVIVKYEFKNKPGDSSYCKPWLTIEPPKGVIRPDEKAILNVEVYVTKETASKLNTGDDKIEDILVLHLEGGKDFFISITGNYLPSCFGSSIETLVRAYGSVRNSATTSELIQLDQPGGGLATTKSGGGSIRSPWAQATAAEFGIVLDGGVDPLPIPKELWRLVEHLYRYGLEEDELFQQPGHQSEITQIRDCLDTGEPVFIPGSVHSVAESFISFLEALAEPVIPFNAYQRCVANTNNFEACKQALTQIPVSHRNVFKYVCSFLRKLLVHSSRNRLDIKFLATLFGGVLMRTPPDTKEVARRMEENRRCAGFIFNFLIHEYDE